MLTQLELFSYFPVPESFRNQEDNVFFAPGQQSITASVGQTNTAPRPQRFQHITQLLAIGPNLSVVNPVDTLAQDFARLIAPTNAHYAGAEGLHNLLALTVVQQHDTAGRRGPLANFPAPA